jgi:hypothetical protein
VTLGNENTESHYRMTFLNGKNIFREECIIGPWRLVYKALLMEKNNPFFVVKRI